MAARGSAASLVGASAVLPRHNRRREQIAEQAADLFAERGFHAVRMQDVARASGMTARALYRYYGNKNDLLSYVIQQGQQRLLHAVEPGGPAVPATESFTTMVTLLAPAALQNIRLAPLWQQEARHLGEPGYAQIRANTHRIAGTVRRALGEQYPWLDDYDRDLRGWAVLSVVTSPSHRDGRYAHAGYAGLLADLSLAVATAGQPPADAVRISPQLAGCARSSASRRECLLTVTAAMLRRHGYGGVSIDDVGREAGIAGPAVYRYFDSKSELLLACVERLHEWIALETTRALAAATDDRDVLPALVAGYLRVAMEATDLLAVARTESQHLPDRARERARRFRVDFAAEWVRWARRRCPQLSDAQAVVRVAAALTVIDDLVRVRRLARDPRFAAELTAIVMAIFGAPVRPLPQEGAAGPPIADFRR